MFERFTERARRTLVLAEEEAKQLGYDSVGPEHLLLGLARGGDALGGALSSRGLGVDALRAAIGQGEEPDDDDDDEDDEGESPPLNASANRALEMALKRSLQLGDEELGKVHLLMGIGDLADDEGLPLLEELGSTGEALRDLALYARGGPEIHLEAPGEGPGGSGARARRSQPAGMQAETPYCPWCDSPYRSRWWRQKASGAEGGPRELPVVVIGCSTCGTVMSVVVPPSG